MKLLKISVFAFLLASCINILANKGDFLTVYGNVPRTDDSTDITEHLVKTIREQLAGSKGTKNWIADVVKNKHKSGLVDVKTDYAPDGVTRQIHSCIWYLRSADVFSIDSTERMLIDHAQPNKRPPSAQVTEHTFKDAYARTTHTYFPDAQYPHHLKTSAWIPRETLIAMVSKQKTTEFYQMPRLLIRQLLRWFRR